MTDSQDPVDKPTLLHREESTTLDLKKAVARLMEAVTRRDFDAIAAVYAPDAVWDVSRLGLEGVFEGRDAIRGAYEALIAPYEQFALVPQDSRDLGNGVTLTIALARGRLRGGSPRFVEARSVTVAKWADGLVERLTIYTDIDEGRAAAERPAQERG
jgi:ketosteroid isomerase-like protein